MTRRTLAAALLLLVACQLAGALAFAAACPEPCPDDIDGSSCPPVCSLCTSCTHARTAIVRVDAMSLALLPATRLFAEPGAIASSPIAAEIFHIPLLG